jgi:hypothetical protein
MHSQKESQVLVIGRSFRLSDSIHIFPRSTSHLGLDDFTPGLPSVAGKEISISLNGFALSVVMASFAATMAFKAFS